MTTRDLSKACPVHGFAKHGKEAEELRAGIEKIINEHCGALDGSDPSRYEEATEDMCDDLQALLDRVDARDSLAYLERKPKKRASKKRATRRVGTAEESK
jgi:hypothetical protein